MKSATIYFHITPWGDWNTPYVPETMDPDWWREYICWGLFAEKEHYLSNPDESLWDAMRYYVALE